MIEDKLRFNKKPKHKSKCLYDFNRYLNNFEKGNYMHLLRVTTKLMHQELNIIETCHLLKAKLLRINTTSTGNDFRLD